VTEENYFFKLSKYQSFIEDLISNDKLKIFPDFRKNEALGFIKKGLVDFSISRSIERAHGWGVPVPGDPSQIMYVWFDALNIYQSGIGFSWNEDNYHKWWPQDVMVIGKGIIRFHAIYWPAILKSAGLKLPKNLFVHGYMTVNGQKMSKTLGNVIDPLELIKKYGSDPLRYYLLREIPSFSDGDFSDRRFAEIYNSDLANGLGNLISRIARVASQTENIIIPNEIVYHELIHHNENKAYITALNEYRFHDALAHIWTLIKETDKYINDNEPWKLKNAEKTNVINAIIPQIQSIATLLLPFLPETAANILKQFKNVKIMTNQPLFPRIEH
jgi:methionyl-tRNA synthetase